VYAAGHLGIFPFKPPPTLPLFQIAVHSIPFHRIGLNTNPPTSLIFPCCFSVEIKFFFSLDQLPKPLIFFPASVFFFFLLGVGLVYPPPLGSTSFSVISLEAGSVKVLPLDPASATLSELMFFLSNFFSSPFPHHLLFKLMLI